MRKAGSRFPVCTLAMSLLAATCAANGAQPRFQCVLVLTPGAEASAWQKFSKKNEVIDSVDKMKAFFPERDFLYVEEAGQPAFVFDREIPELRWRVSAVTALDALLHHADADGIVALRDLSQDELEAVAYIFGSAGLEMVRGGSNLSQVKMRLSAELVVDAAVNGESVSCKIEPSYDAERKKRVTNELVEGALVMKDLSEKEREAIYAEGRRRSSETYGLGFRFVGIHDRLQTEMSRRALDSLKRYLAANLDASRSLLDEAEGRLAGSQLTEYGGTVPDSLLRSKMSGYLWGAFANQIRADPARYRLDGSDAANAFLAGVQSVGIQVAYELSYFVSSDNGTGATSRPVGYRAELIRH